MQKTSRLFHLKHTHTQCPPTGGDSRDMKRIKKSAPPKKNTPAANTLQHRMEGMPLPPPPPPTQCYPLDSFYSPPHPTIRQRIKCRGSSFLGGGPTHYMPPPVSVATHDSVQQAIAAVVVLAKPTFYSLPSHWILQNIKTDTYSFDGWNRCLF